MLIFFNMLSLKDTHYNYRAYLEVKTCFPLFLAECLSSDKLCDGLMYIEINIVGGKIGKKGYISAILLCAVNHFGGDQPITS